MKKLSSIVFVFFCFIFASCGVGTFSHSSGIDDKSYVMFTTAQRENIDVEVDGQKYQVKTVEKSAYKARRDIKKSATTCIPITVGQHRVKVTNSNGIEIYNKTIFVATTEIKNIEL